MEVMLEFSSNEQFQKPCWQISMPSLLVVGHARSGTTALMQQLNQSPSVFITGELNVHYLDSLPDQNSKTSEMVVWSRKREKELRRSQIYLRSKGQFSLPGENWTVSNSSNHLNQILSPNFLHPEYRWLGDKIAVANRTFINGETDISLLENLIPKLFHSNSDNRIILTFRRPIHSILSTMNMFPAFDFTDTLNFYELFFEWQLTKLSDKRFIPIFTDKNGNEQTSKILELLEIRDIEKMDGKVLFRDIAPKQQLRYSVANYKLNVSLKSRINILQKKYKDLYRRFNVLANNFRIN